MSEHSQKSNSLVSPYREDKESEPVFGHGGTSYEGTDLKAGMIINTLAIIGGTLLVVFAFTIGIQRLLEKANPRGQLPSAVAPARVIPSGPLLQVYPWDELPDLRAHEDQVLGSYGKDANGHVHIPITQAMNEVVGKIPVAANAPEGIRTPGGQGRAFARSLNDMPPQYKQQQKPVPATIVGEIRKNAQ